MADGNLIKKLSSGLSVFGWYTKFDESGEASVHVDLGFNTGKFGAKPEDRIQFELDFKRVELVVICGDGVSPIKSSIARTVEFVDGKIYSVQETTTEAEVNGKASISQSTMPTFDFSASGKALGSSHTKIEKVVSTTAVIIRHMLTDNRNPTWDIRESTGGTLSGTPWDAVKEPRFKFRFAPGRIDRQPSIRVLVKCRSEDLILRSVKIKDEKQESLWRKNRNVEANRIAAEQFLKELILKEGLPLPHLEQDYGEVTVADVVLTAE